MELIQSKIRLTNKNTVAIIDSLESDKIYSLYVDDYKENRKSIKDLLKNTYEHIATLITKGDFEEAKEYANNLGNIISLRNTNLMRKQIKFTIIL